MKDPKTTSITPIQISSYAHHLALEEKSSYTIDKYLRDAKAFTSYLEDRRLTKEVVLSYKSHLIEEGYAISSINSMLASVNSFLRYLDCEDCKVRPLRTQKKMYRSKEKELTREEYIRLLGAARKRPQLYMVIETICATGIRISELKYFTVEGVQAGEINVSCKNKTRTILLPVMLRKVLLAYAKENHIQEGILFLTRYGNPLNRSNIWSAMKSLCKSAHVEPSKVYPHNLRKLFARSFYQVDKDMAKLADILGHSNINTTRIYIMSTSREHQRKIDQLGLVV